MPVDGLDRSLRRLAVMKRELSGDAESKRLLRIARAVRPMADAQVRADIGDQSMSGWSHRSPVPIVSRARLSSPTSAVVEPTPKTRGPWRVMQSGRQAYAAGDRRVAGVRYRKRTNDYVLKTRLVKRNVGATRGRGTWTKAESAMATAARSQHTREVISKFRSTFRG